MSKLRILYVASEIDPFLKISEAADLLRQLPQAMQERGWRFAFWFPGLD
jgi:starch synthase